MKAVVLETRDGYAAVLREDGTVEKIRRDCRVGETIELTEKANIVRFPGKAAKWTAAAAAAVVLLSAGGTYGFNNAYAYSFVTLDANPSIEYVLNRKNQIIDVQALNEDAESVAAELGNVRKATLTDAMAATTEILYEQEYLGEEQDNCLLINISSRGEEQQTALTEEVDAYFSALDEDALEVYVTNADREELAEAEAMGVSAGRYMLLRDIEEPDSVDVREEPVRQLLEESGRRTAKETETFAAATGEPAAQSVSPNAEQAPADNGGAAQQGTAGESRPGTPEADAAAGQEMGSAPDSGQPVDGSQPVDGREGGGASGEPS